jgi:hypothetical protein
MILDVAALPRHRLLAIPLLPLPARMKRVGARRVGRRSA